MGASRSPPKANHANMNHAECPEFPLPQTQQVIKSDPPSCEEQCIFFPVTNRKNSEQNLNASQTMTL